MAKSFAYEVVETSSTTGTGTYSLAGIPAGSAYRTCRQEFSNGETKIVYMVRNAANTKWEKNRFGTLTYATPDTLTRNVIKSTNSDAAVSWVAGDLPLTIYIPADQDVHEGAITGWLATARNALIRYGVWFKQDSPSAGKVALNVYNGTQDIRLGVVGTDNTIAMDCAPAGIVLPYAGSTAPAGFLLCYGQAVSRTTYAVLFAVIGTTFGAGDGSTTFNLPDLRGRAAVGKDDMGGTAANRVTNAGSGITGTTLGAPGGAQNHTHTVTSTGNTMDGPNSTSGVNNGTDFQAATSVHSHANMSVTGTTAATSSMQPTLILNQIISTGGV